MIALAGSASDDPLRRAPGGRPRRALPRHHAGPRQARLASRGWTPRRGCAARSPGSAPSAGRLSAAPRARTVRPPPAAPTRERPSAHAHPRHQRPLPRPRRRPGRRRPDRRRRRGGAVHPAQARQAAGAVLRLGAARAGRRLVPGRAGLRPGDLDAVAYSFDPACPPRRRDGPGRSVGPPAAHLRPARAPASCATALPGLDPAAVRFVPHHVAHAASGRPRRARAGDCAVLVLDGRGEARLPPGRPPYRDGRLEIAAPPRSSRTRSAWSTRSSPSTSASCAPATSTR